jgi:regulator of protease activity HflC (stomatin/prohibitin superfamily)
MPTMTKVLMFGAAAVALCGCDVIPSYRVYNARKTGEAELAQADGNRQIKVQEAKALYESADYMAKAEVRKAEGVAAANKIMSESLGGPEGYLRWKYIEMLQESKNNQVIYVPTEANLPILEAGKRVTEKTPK